MHILLQDIHKYYGSIRANDGIDLEIKPGLIHGMVGENGAGKTTLMKILAGYAAQTKGMILVDGRPAAYRGPAQAARLGIGMLYQDPLDFPALTVLENYKIGLLSGDAAGPAYDQEKLRESAAHFGFTLPEHERVRNLTVGERRQLELLRLLARGVEVLILDEPTTGISNRQKELLFRALKQLAAAQKSIVLVSHKLEDIEALCDQITVLRRGRVVGDMDRPFDLAHLIEWMFGDPAPAPPACEAACRPSRPVLTLEEVTATGGRSGLTTGRVVIAEGEIVGLAGLEGSGQEIFLRLSAGMQTAKRGYLKIGEENMTGRPPADFQSRGAAFIPSARLEEGLVPGLSISEHFALKQKKFFISSSAAGQVSSEKINRFKIAGRPETAVESLSGGNQQRLLLSFLPDAPRLLLLENPLRGLDLESAQWVRQYLTEHARQGAAIVFSSPELDEILQMATRILVFFNGRIVKDIQTRDTSLHEIGEAIAGGERPKTEE